MSFEVLEKLEAKIQAAVDTITLQQLEIEELKESKTVLEQEAEQLKASREEVEAKMVAMQQEHSQWQERIRSLLGKMEDVE
jgi:cell division protein ZapB